MSTIEERLNAAIEAANQLDRMVSPDRLELTELELAQIAAAAGRIGLGPFYEPLLYCISAREYRTIAAELRRYVAVETAERSGHESTHID